jgi:tetratricopeptide (TPR) repeat protein
MLESDTDGRLHSVEEQITQLYDVSKNTAVGITTRELELKDRVDRILSDLPNAEHTDSKFTAKQKAKIYFLRGKALEVLPQYSKEAEECLSRAVKFAPEMMDAWNSLGHCFWKKNDLVSAHNCYTTALQLSPNKVSYRELSRILRLIDVSKQISDSDGEKLKNQRVENVVQSVATAKKAVGMDLEDGESWCEFNFDNLDNH